LAVAFHAPIQTWLIAGISFYIFRISLMIKLLTFYNLILKLIWNFKKLSADLPLDSAKARHL
jgi:hypothetical protein